MQPPTYIIWGDEIPFSVYAESAAKETFDLLDKGLSPRLVLVGVSLREDDAKPRFSVVPKSSRYSAGMFAGIEEEAGQMRFTAQQKPFYFARFQRYVDEANAGTLGYCSEKIREVIVRNTERAEHITYCSLPTTVGDYWVFAVLQLKTAASERHPRLRRREVNDVAVEPSLIDAVAYEFLELCAFELSVPDPGRSFRAWRRRADEIVRAGGRRLMTFPIAAAGNDWSPDGFFLSMDAISALRYEGEVGSGRMLIAARGHKNVEVTVRFLEGVEVADHRAVRKLLRLTSRELALLCDTTWCYGLGKTAGVYASEQEDLFAVAFVKEHTWQLLHADQVLMHVRYSEPQFYRDEFPQEEFAAGMREVFPTVTVGELGGLATIAALACKEKHGTMLVVCKEASKEATRLKEQSTPIEPQALTPDLLELVTKIDGAVLVGLDGVCHAVGVILDGKATTRGTRSRGSRYNSALKYADSCDYPAVVVVKSEDGMIDIVIPQTTSPKGTGGPSAAATGQSPSTAANS